MREVLGSHLRNWNFFNYPSRYETGRFREVSETRIPKPKPDFKVRKLSKGPKTREIGTKTRKIFGRS